MNIGIYVLKFSRQRIDFKIANIFNSALMSAYIVIFDYIGIAEKKV